MEVSFEDQLYDFPDEVTDEEILSFFSPKEEEPAPPVKLDPGVYQDEEGKLFKVTSDNEIKEIE